MALAVEYTKSAAKYLDVLDTVTRSRIIEKVANVAEEPDNPRHSYPLKNSQKRSARVGKYRVLLLVQEEALIVADIDSRGQVYRNA
jgi:mRNA-degrading endonuclease RelE of RelBE toxin-antitoxin system